MNVKLISEELKSNLYIDFICEDDFIEDNTRMRCQITAYDMSIKTFSDILQYSASQDWEVYCNDTYCDAAGITGSFYIFQNIYDPDKYDSYTEIKDGFGNMPKENG